MFSRLNDETIDLEKQTNEEIEKEQKAWDTKRKYARKLRKKLKSMKDLEADPKKLNEEQRSKLATKAAVVVELAELDRELNEHDSIVGAEQAAKKAAKDEKKCREQAEVDKVDNLLETFGDKYHCPVCQELLETATKVSQCGHTFCRDCILEVARKAEEKRLNVGKKIDPACPLCRTPFEGSTLKAATSMRKKMAKLSAICPVTDCGQSIFLSQMRQHLRQHSEIGQILSSGCPGMGGSGAGGGKNQPLSLATHGVDTPMSGLQSDYVREEEERAILERVMRASLAEYEWNSSYGVSSAPPEAEAPTTPSASAPPPAPPPAPAPPAPPPAPAPAPAPPAPAPAPARKATATSREATPKRNPTNPWGKQSK